MNVQDKIQIDHFFFLQYSQRFFNSLPNDKFLDWSKLKAFSDNKINVIVKLKFVLQRIENLVGKRENAGYQHFLLFTQCFQKPSLSGFSKAFFVRRQF